ncbi:hypothetical protein ACRAKI_19705 [Saccharothrix isguenensis]
MRPRARNRTFRSRDAVEPGHRHGGRHGCDAAVEEKAVRKAFDDYQEAARAKDGVAMVYVLRAEFDAVELRGMSAEQLVSAAVDKGLISENSLDNVDLGTVVVDGGTAQADMTSRGESAGVELPFHKEDGSWRFDLRPLMAAGTRRWRPLPGSVA